MVRLKDVLIACTGLLVLLYVFSWFTDHAWVSWLGYALLPTLPLLAALYAMHWVKGIAYTWWFRAAVPWTIASIGVVILTPSYANGVALKGIVATLSVLIFCIGTLAIIVRKSLVEQYRIAMAE